MNIWQRRSSRVARQASTVAMLCSLGMLFLTAPAFADARGSHWAPSEISVSGKGEVAVIPDTAVLTASVRQEADNPQKALSLAAESAESALAQLVELGVEERDISTRSVSLSPVHDRDGQFVRGWRANTTIVVKLRKIELFGRVASALAELGVDDIRGPSLQVGEPEEYRKAARLAAMNDAREAAEQLAAAAGLVITEAKSISLSDGGGSIIPMARMEMAASSAQAAGMPVAPGEQLVTSHVQVTWKALPERLAEKKAEKLRHRHPNAGRAAALKQGRWMHKSPILSLPPQGLPAEMMQIHPSDNDRGVARRVKEKRQ